MMTRKKIDPKEDILDSKTIEEIKKSLLAEKKVIETDLDRFEHQNEHTDDKNMAKFPNYGDKLDESAQEIVEFSTNAAKAEVLIKSLRDINSALKSIEDGAYGKCKYCHKDIGRKRLLARPVASACIKCKTKLQNS